ncbi:hypothetical protein CDAR_83231 [Caerostris darwini]|uniref:EGF-like domain-containing protein n=1 Tax=Caerostris darwini TaxID=1538125 RepID=A0AAV4SKE3_9ARAC|nr:hypothetical protein CDAR_83231 [Caerostris darwini]
MCPIKCDCGEKGTCSIVNGLKRCTCQEGYTDADGICKECDCGEKGTCTFIYGLKWCACEKGHTEVDGICKECDCGEKGTCSFINGLKKVHLRKMVMQRLMEFAKTVIVESTLILATWMQWTANFVCATLDMCK